MATKVKPTRLNVTWVPQVGKVPTYVDKNTFAWWNWWGGGWYWRFLSLWDCSTWMPISFPEATPYTYLTWDYFLVEVVDSSDPATNYKPNWATYTWAASTTVESDSVAKWDVYVYDWTVWLLQSNSEKSVSFSNITWQPTDNINLAADLNAKQDNLTAWNWINIDASNKISTTFIYWESSTAAATVQKEVSIPSITSLNVWQVIIVKPSTTSSVASSTLKLNSFPAYKMLYNGAEITTSTDSVVWSANVPSMFYLDEVSGTKYWRFLGHWLDSNSTYTLNQLIDAWKYEAWTWTYAITRYSLCMMKADGTWEKITNTAAAYSTWTTKTVNTNWFVLNQIKYYNTTWNVAGGTFVATNTLTSQSATVTLAYSFNCGTAPWWTVWQPIYIVGTMWVDWLFYLDTTARWTTTLPSTNNWKLYIRIWTALAADNSAASFLQDRPIFYYNNWIKEYTTWKIDELETWLTTKQDELVSWVNIRTINWTSILWNWDITTPTWIPSQTWEAGKFLTTDWTSVSWWTVSAWVTSVNWNTWAVTVREVPSVWTNWQVLTVVSWAAAWANAAWSDYSWVTKTISWWEIELWLRTIVNVPTSNFTLTAPATLKDWEEYAIRIISETSYTMTLWTWFTNPRNVDTTLSGNATDQYVFLAINGELELQPLVDTWA